MLVIVLPTLWKHKTELLKYVMMVEVHKFNSQVKVIYSEQKYHFKFFVFEVQKQRQNMSEILIKHILNTIELDAGENVNVQV